MTEPFMRVDVSQKSRDFQPVALEPGLPLLDRTNSNYQTLRKWLGASVAEFEKSGDRVAFYIRDDQGHRRDRVFCLPVSEKDLTGELAKDFKELLRRIDAAKPTNANEQLLLRVAQEQIRGLAEEVQARDRRCYLFKYRDAQNKLHLVWAPGYRRRDTEPGAPLVCTSTSCSHLFLQRRDTGAKCPICSETIRQREGLDSRRPTNWWKRLLAVVLIFCLGGGTTYWWLQQKKNPPEPIPVAQTAPLVVEPAQWSGPVGSQVQFVIKKNDGANGQVVTTAAAAKVANPKVLSVKPFENLGKAISPGETEITFFVDTMTVTARVTVEPRRNPQKLVLQPDKLELGVGTTAQVKLLGEFEGGRTADLTDDAEWEARHDDKFFVHKGRVEGEEEGSGTLRVRYRAHDKAEPLEATAAVVVRDHQYKTLRLVLEPAAPTVGQPARLSAIATSEAGAEFSVAESKDLTVTVAPAEKATLRGSELHALADGDVKLTGLFRGLSASVEAKISKPPTGPIKLDVSPRTLELSLGEVARLDVLTAQPASVKMTSSQPRIVEVAANGGLVGRGVGNSEVEVTDGTETVKVAVKVSEAKWASLAIEPTRMSLKSDESVGFKVFGVIDASHRAELAADQLNWAKLPRSEFVEFSKSALQVKGLKATGDSPETLTVRAFDREASAEVTVVAPPLVLVLTPEGSIEIPIGQKKSLRVQARYGGQTPVDVPGNRVEWVSSTETGFEISHGEIHAKLENAQTTLTAKYQGATSNELKVSSAAATPLTLRLTAAPSELSVGGSGIVLVFATGPGGDVDLSIGGMKFESMNSELLSIADTGAFRALRAGSAKIRATHPAAKQPAEVSVTIHPATPEIVAKPASLRIVSKSPAPVTLPVGAEFSDLKVESIAADGSATDVTRAATLIIENGTPPAGAADSGAKDTASELLEFVSKLLPKPEETAVIQREGRLVGVNPGEATVQATYGGVRTTQGLRVQVTAGLEIDEIRIEPGELHLVLGESVSVRATGFKSGQSVGDVSPRGDLVWKSKDDKTVQADGSQLTALQPGSTTVTAQWRNVVSKPVTVTVVAPTDQGQSPAVVGPLTVSPSPLRLQVGEIARLGTEVVVRRGDVDFSDQCEVSTAANRIVAFQEEGRSLLGVSPGRSRVTMTVRDQPAVLEVEVRAAEVADNNSKVLIEPATGRLSVGERLPVQVFVINSTGERAPVNAVLTSSDDKLATTSATALQGLAPGEVTLLARVPGIDASAKAVFQVEELDVEKLVFVPAVMSLSVGQRKFFAVEAITPQGHKKLSGLSDLKLSVAGENGSVIELADVSQEVLGVRPGQAKIIAKWKGGLERSLTVNVQSDPIQELVITPEEATIVEGEAADFQVFARRGGRLQPMQALDGVTLSVANSVVAEADKSDLRVTGLQAGQTQVAARFGSRRAVAQLTVTPRPTPAAPPAAAASLRFIPDIFRLELGTPGDSIRVVRVLADGTQEDVDHLVTLKVRDPQDVIEIENSASGPVVRPKRVGQTQVDATLGTLQTAKPLLVDVAQKIAQPARLRVAPTGLQLEVGQTSSFTRAEVIPPTGRSAIPVPFTVTATPNNVFEILPSGVIRAKAPGQAICTVTANDAEKKYEGVSTSVSVEVTDPNAPPPPPANSPPGAVEETNSRPQLVLEGPSETTVGAEVKLRAESVTGDRGTDVTTRVRLVLPAGDDRLAEVRPGGVIVTKAPGRLSVQARMDDLTSAPHEIVIKPVASEFERLELDVAKGRMGVGESRAYQLWGYPRNGGARQDLTSLVTDESGEASRPRLSLEMLEPNPGTQVAAHRAGSLIGRQPGRFKAQASLGDRLTSNAVTLDVVGSVDAPERMRLEPDQLRLLVGESTPALRVLVASRGDRNFRAIDNSLIQITSGNPEILQPAEEGRFTALKPGQTSLKVAYQGLEQSVPVTVNFNPFANIEIGPNPKISESTMTVDLKVSANTTDATLEYRCLLPNRERRPGSETAWVKAERDGPRLNAKLSSPKIPLKRGQNEYSLLIEAKNLKDGSVQTHPFAFRIVSSAAGSEKPAVEK